MSKGKLSLGLVTSFIAAMAMTACSSVKSDPKAIVTFTGYNGETIDVITDDLYSDYLKTSSGISKFYDEMLRVLIRYEYENENSALWTNVGEKPAKTFSSVQNTAKDKLAGLKDDAKKASKDNGTSYDKEWDKVLEGQGVEDDKELLQKLIYNIEKEEVEDWYFRDNEEDLLDEYLGLSETQAVSGFPYHIRHILASVSAGANDFYNGTISESEALKLYTIAKSLRDGKMSFGEIAEKESGDTSSAEDGLRGSVGIMDRTTSFVNEFKLGIYAYDAVYSKNSSDDYIKNETLGLTEEVEHKLDTIGLAYVPYAAFEAINEYKDVDTDEAGHQVNDGNANYYPRNIYWNKYLNRHNVFVITNNTVGEYADVYSDITGDGIDPVQIDASIHQAVDGRTGFRYVDGLSKDNHQLILTDEEARPIICVRSDHGIHFMIIEKSAFEDDVDDYYSTKIPGDEGYDADSFVGYLKTTATDDYKKRAKTIEEKIKGFDSTYDYRVFEELLAGENGKVTFYSEGDINLEKAVADYIASQRDYNSWNALKTMNESWRTYLELIDVQNSNRVAERLIPEMCALKFKDGNTDPEFKDEHGGCYYAK